MTRRARTTGGPSEALRTIAALVHAAAIALGALPAASGAAGGGPVPPDAEIVLWEPCTRGQADRWAEDAGRDGRAALRAAGCYASLIEGGEEESAGLADARRGRRAAEAACAFFPESGMAHYLAAYLAGREAERAPFRGLSLVPVVEREAKRAASLSAGVDRAGPDRMLGELYLRAPGFPLSVGDKRKAVTHYRRAVSLAPQASENRLGLAEALLAGKMNGEACGELRALAAGTASPGAERAVREKAAELFGRHCSREAAP